MTTAVDPDPPLLPPSSPAFPPSAGGPVWRQVVGLAWPALAQQGLLLAIQLYDQYLTGPFSPAHKAALTTANYLYWFVTAYAVVVNAGATALVGRLVGAGDLDTARRVTGQALGLSAAFGLVGAAAAFAFMADFVRILRLPEPAAGFAVEYLMPLAGLLPFYMIEVGGIACLIGAGDTRTGLKVLATVLVLNVPLAGGLSRGWFGLPELGFVGIAWGTGLSHVVGCGLVLLTLARGRFGLTVRPADLFPDRGLLVRLLRVSLPAAVDSLSIALFQFVFLGIIIGLGETAAAAHGIALRVEGLGYLSGA
ncbi:MAG: MATE family efflux transporter, partial [Fimbriiglobus sp.]